MWTSAPALSRSFSFPGTTVDEQWDKSAPRAQTIEKTQQLTLEGVGTEEVSLTLDEVDMAFHPPLSIDDVTVSRCRL
jgi:hypothetical protein